MTPTTDSTAARRLELAADGAMDVDDAVKFSGVGRTSLYAAMDDGSLAYTQPNRKRLILKRSLVEWLAAHAVVVTA